MSYTSATTIHISVSRSFLGGRGGRGGGAVVSSIFGPGEYSYYLPKPQMLPIEYLRFPCYI